MEKNVFEVFYESFCSNFLQILAALDLSVKLKLQNKNIFIVEGEPCYIEKFYELKEQIVITKNSLDINL